MVVSCTTVVCLPKFFMTFEGCEVASVVICHIEVPLRYKAVVVVEVTSEVC